MQEEMRVCTRCGEEKLVDRQFLPKGKICWDCREVARLASNVNWRAKNTDYLRDKREYWNYLNPDKPTQYAASRRAAKLMAKGIFTQEDIRLVKESQNNRCPYCNCYLDSSYHVDHIFPISKYFYNGPENIQLLCGSCNAKKKDMDPYLYEEKIGLSGSGRRLELDKVKAVISAAHEGVSLDLLHKEWRTLTKSLVREKCNLDDEEATAYKDYRNECIWELEDYRRNVDPPEAQSTFYTERYTYEMWGHF